MGQDFLDILYQNLSVSEKSCQFLFSNFLVSWGKKHVYRLSKK